MTFLECHLLPQKVNIFLIVGLDERETEVHVRFR